MPKTVGYAAESITAAHGDWVRDARELLEGGKQARGIREPVWTTSQKQYEGRFWTDLDNIDPTADLTSVNISFGTANTILPNITGQEPVFMIEPFSQDATPANAAKQEAFLNRLWRHKAVGAQTALKQATHFAVVLGDGFMKTTYQINRRLKNPDEPVDTAEIFVDSVSPWDIWIDPYGTSIYDARWVCHRVWSTKRQIENDERYTVPEDFEYHSRMDTENPAQSTYTDRTITSDGDDWVELFEFYDLIDRSLVVFPKQGSGPSDLPWMVVEEIELPFAAIEGYTRSIGPWHMGDLEQIADLQDELNKTRSELMTHRRRNVAKVLIREKSMGQTAIDALSSPIVGQFVPIKGDEPLDQLVSPINLQPIASENYASSSQILDDVREITGVTEYQRGIGSDTSRTATEASIMEASANVKIQAKLTAVEEASRVTGSLILGIAKDVFPLTDEDEMAMWIGGPDARRAADTAIADKATQLEGKGQYGQAQKLQSLTGQVNQVVLKPNEAMFIGVYEVLVTTGSTEYRNPKLREEKYKTMFFDLLGASPQLAQMGINLDFGRLLRIWMESADIADIDAILAPAPQGPVPGDPALGDPALQDPSLQQQAPAGTPDPSLVPSSLPPGGEIPPDLLQLLGGEGGGIDPTLEQLPSNTGILEEGEVAPNVLA